MFEYQLNMAETVGFAIILLLLGRWIKKKVNFFEKFFIPAPVIGGTLFSIILLIGHQTESFTFTSNNDIKNLLMIAFFTTVGFSASLKILSKGGVGVALFLLAATILVILQDIVGNISLSLFLSMALMSIKLWELVELAGPLSVILIVQTILMAVFAYFVTFNIMGRDYDAAVISTGHCGFGLGATPNAIANMETFTATNGPSVKAFFIIPIVESLFIDFVNSMVIKGFASWIVANFM